MATTSYDRWRQNLATTLWSWNNRQTAAANAATERDRNAALAQAERLRGVQTGIPQAAIDRDRNALLAAQERFRAYAPDFSATNAMTAADRAAGVAAGEGIARGGTAMEDRTALLGGADRLEQAAADIGAGERSELDRARMMRELAEFRAESAGLGEAAILETLNRSWAQEQARNAASLNLAVRTAAARGVQLDEWALSQISAQLNAESAQRLAETETALRLEDLKLRQTARMFELGQMADVLKTTRAQELEAAGLSLQGRTAAQGARADALASTRQDQLARETAGAAHAQGAREAGRSTQATVDQVREQLRLSRDTAGLELLDRALAMGRGETRANQAGTFTREQAAAEMVVRILEGTQRQVMDPGALAKMIAMIAG